MTAAIDAQREYLRCLDAAYPGCAMRLKLWVTLWRPCGDCTTAIPITLMFLEAS